MDLRTRTPLGASSRSGMALVTALGTSLPLIFAAAWLAAPSGEAPSTSDSPQGAQAASSQITSTHHPDEDLRSDLIAKLSPRVEFDNERVRLRDAISVAEHAPAAVLEDGSSNPWATGAGFVLEGIHARTLNADEMPSHDLDGDGTDDMIVPQVLPGDFAHPDAAGRIRVFERAGEDVVVDYPGFIGGELFGIAADFIGDIDGDGVSDLAVGAPGADVLGPDSGVVYLISGADQRLLNILATTESTWGLGLTVAGAGDADGDGTPDILATGRRWNGTHWVPIVCLFSGIDGFLLRTITTDVPDDGFGYAMTAMGDLNNDGYGDFAISSPLRELPTSVPAGPSGQRPRGVVSIFAGQLVPQSLGLLEQTPRNAQLTIYNQDDRDTEFGTFLTRATDSDADGMNELLVASRLDTDADETYDAIGYATYEMVAGVKTWSAEEVGGTHSPSDTNWDLIVSIDDLNTVLTEFGNEPEPDDPFSADGNGSGTVDLDDLSATVQSYDRASPVLDRADKIGPVLNKYGVLFSSIYGFPASLFDTDESGADIVQRAAGPGGAVYCILCMVVGCDAGHTGCSGDSNPLDNQGPYPIGPGAPGQDADDFRPDHKNPDPDCDSCSQAERPDVDFDEIHTIIAPGIDPDADQTDWPVFIATGSVPSGVSTRATLTIGNFSVPIPCKSSTTRLVRLSPGCHPISIGADCPTSKKDEPYVFGAYFTQYEKLSDRLSSVKAWPPGRDYGDLEVGEVAYICVASIDIRADINRDEAINDDDQADITEVYPGTAFEEGSSIEDILPGLLLVVNDDDDNRDGYPDNAVADKDNPDIPDQADFNDPDDELALVEIEPISIMDNLPPGLTASEKWWRVQLGGLKAYLDRNKTEEITSGEIYNTPWPTEIWVEAYRTVSKIGGASVAVTLTADLEHADWDGPQPISLRDSITCTTISVINDAAEELSADDAQDDFYVAFGLSIPVNFAALERNEQLAEAYRLLKEEILYEEEYSIVGEVRNDDGTILDDYPERTTVLNDLYGLEVVSLPGIPAPRTYAIGSRWHHGHYVPVTTTQMVPGAPDQSKSEWSVVYETATRSAADRQAGLLEPGGQERAVCTLIARDQFNNLIPEGTDVLWMVREGEAYFDNDHLDLDEDIDENGIVRAAVALQYHDPVSEDDAIHISAIVDGYEIRALADVNNETAILHQGEVSGRVDLVPATDTLQLLNVPPDELNREEDERGVVSIPVPSLQVRLFNLNVPAGTPVTWHARNCVFWTGSGSVNQYLREWQDVVTEHSDPLVGPGTAGTPNIIAFAPQGNRMGKAMVTAVIAEETFTIPLNVHDTFPDLVTIEPVSQAVDPGAVGRSGLGPRSGVAALDPGGLIFADSVHAVGEGQEGAIQTDPGTWIEPVTLEVSQEATTLPVASLYRVRVKSAWFTTPLGGVSGNPTPLELRLPGESVFRLGLYLSRPESDVPFGYTSLVPGTEQSHTYDPSPQQLSNIRFFDMVYQGNQTHRAWATDRGRHHQWIFNLPFPHESVIATEDEFVFDFELRSTGNLTGKWVEELKEVRVHAVPLPPATWWMFRANTSYLGYPSLVDTYPDIRDYLRFQLPADPDGEGRLDLPVTIVADHGMTLPHQGTAHPLHEFSTSFYLDGPYHGRPDTLPSKLHRLPEENFPDDVTPRFPNLYELRSLSLPTPGAAGWQSSAMRAIRAEERASYLTHIDVVYATLGGDPVTLAGERAAMAASVIPGLGTLQGIGSGYVTLMQATGAAGFVGLDDRDVSIFEVILAPIDLLPIVPNSKLLTGTAGELLKRVGGSVKRAGDVATKPAKRMGRALNQRMRSTTLRAVKLDNGISALRLADGTILSDEVLLDTFKFLDELSDEAMEAMIRGGFKNGAAVDDLMIIASRTDTKGFLDDIATIVGEDPRLAEHVGDYLGYLRRHAKGKPVGRAVSVTDAQRFQFTRASLSIQDYIGRTGRKGAKSPDADLSILLKNTPEELVQPVSEALDAFAELAKVAPLPETGQSSIGILAMLKRLREEVAGRAPTIEQIRAIELEAIAAKRIIDGEVPNFVGRVRNVGGKTPTGDLDAVLDNIPGVVPPGALCVFDAKSVAEVRKSIEKALRSPSTSKMNDQLKRLRESGNQFVDPQFADGAAQRSFFGIRASEVGTQDYDLAVAKLEELMRDQGNVDILGRWEIVIIPD